MELIQWRERKEAVIQSNHRLSILLNGLLLLRRNARRLGTLASLSGFKRHPLPFTERLESFSQDIRMMYEKILRAVIRNDESISLFVAEPLYGTTCH